MPKFRTFAKPSLTLFLFAGLLLFSCNQSARKAAPPFEPILPFKPVKVADTSSHPGYVLYVKHCHQCHQQAHPATLSVEKWKNTVPFMAKHAGITQADGKKILEYILLMKSQGVQ